MAGKYATQGMAEGLFQPGSRNRVLANTMGIVLVRDIQRAESEALLALTEGLLEEVTDNQRFTARDLLTFHRRWLGGIYVWAGAYRGVNMTKDGFPFAAANLLPQLMATYERDVLAAETPCVGMNEERLITALARTHAEYILVHPFRDGNGRLIRLVNSLMAFQAGLPALDYGGIRGQKKKAYFAAIHAALGRNYAPLEQVFRSVLKRTLASHRA